MIENAHLIIFGAWIGHWILFLLLCYIVDKKCEPLSKEQDDTEFFAFATFMFSWLYIIGFFLIITGVWK